MSQQDSPQPSGTHSNEAQPHEAQRIEAWAAVHRPETSSEDLARIAEAHPEFVPAISEHPNAPAPPQANVSQPSSGPTEYAQAQYSQPQYAQPQHTQPQPEHPQHTHPQYAQAQYPTGQYAAPAKSSVNVAGIIAFSLLVVVTVLEFFIPVVMRQAMLNYDLALMVGFPLTRLLLVVCALVLGIVGARMRSKPRLRWMAVGSIVAGAFLAIPLLLTTISYAAPGALPFYGY